MTASDDRPDAADGGEHRDRPAATRPERRAHVPTPRTGGGPWWAEPAAVVDAFDVPAVLVDRRGRVVHANAAAGPHQAAAGRTRGPGGGRLEDLFVDPDAAAVDDATSAALAGRPWTGRLRLRGPSTGAPVVVTCTPLRHGEGVAGFVCVLGTSPTGPEDGYPLGARLARLARVTTELVKADSVEDVCEIVVTHGADAAGASLASLTLRETPETLRVVGLRGLPPTARRWTSYPASLPTPASDAIRTNGRVVLCGAAAIAEAYPDLTDADLGERTLACLPLRESARTLGALGLSFPGGRDLGETELEFLEILADSCAQALERISAQEAAAAQGAKLAFLADASTELASSLDYQATLANVAHLAVPAFADWCAIDLVEDGRLHRVAVAHVDPAKVQLARDLAEQYPSDHSAAWSVIRSGRSELIAEITDEVLTADADGDGDERVAAARALQLHSALTVPLQARNRVRGVLTWVWAESGNTYTSRDLALAEELAKRAAVAIDNAELHSQTLAAAVHLQRAVLPERLPQVAGWDVAGYYSPAGRTDVGGDFYDVIPLADGRVALCVGDVMGRGVAAAAEMAQMRATVRAYAAVDPDPVTVMGKLDQMCAQFPTDQLVTLVYLVADPGTDELVIANAGHPPPVLLRADGRVEELPLADGCPLGVGPQDRVQQTVRFEVGDLVLGFTDGLIERRGEDITAGQQRVRNHAGRLGRGLLPAALDEVVDRLRDPSRDDDVAALAARRTR